MVYKWYIKESDMKEKKIYYKSLQVDSELKRKIEYLTKITGVKSQNQFLNNVITPLFEVGSFFHSAELDSYPIVQRSNIVFQYTRTTANKLAFTKKSVNDFKGND